MLNRSWRQCWEEVGVPLYQLLMLRSVMKVHVPSAGRMICKVGEYVLGPLDNSVSDLSAGVCMATQVSVSV